MNSSYNKLFHETGVKNIPHYRLLALSNQPSSLEGEWATKKQVRHTLSGIDQIPAELVKTGNRTIRSEIYKLII